jgi:hypothetical protein
MPHISYPEPCVIVELCETTAVPSGLFYQMQMKTPSQPADVARVIHEAVTAKEPRLRYLVGDDAERLVAGRQRLTDEEYVATGRLMPDAEYLDLMRQRYGFQW